MSTLPAPDLRRLAAARLTARRDELDQRLHAAVLAATGAAGASGDVHDFKEAAADASQAVLTDTELAHAAQERDAILAALRRLHDGTYGTCAGCGEPIPAGRLQALPAAAFCAACQTAREPRHAAGH